eukprot:c32547_g1_i1.p1 GENE.c32547_g1_i1~~c32547_g1_i1.p1  ORF type:complete len:213 (-),score=54.30 c32547_g1_i1:97-735(-)
MGVVTLREPDRTMASRMGYQFVRGLRQARPMAQFQSARGMTTAAFEGASAKDPFVVRFIRGGISFVVIPVFAWKVVENLVNNMDFSVKYDPSKLLEAPATVVVNELSEDRSGSFWFEYTVDGKKRTSQKLTPTNYISTSELSTFIPRYPAGSQVVCKYNKDHADFAFLEHGIDHYDGRKVAQWLAVADVVILYATFKVFRGVRNFSLSRLRR